MLNSTKSKYILKVSGVIIILVILMISYNIWLSRNSEIAVGTYMTSSGDGYIVIERDFLWGIKVKEAMFTVNYFPFSEEYHRFYGISLINDEMNINQHELFINPSRGDVKIALNMKLKPSKDTIGDWDLINSDLKIRSNAGQKLFTMDFWSDATSGSFREFRKNLSMTFKNEDYGTVTLDPSKSPVKSYLHKIDDPLLAEYFKARFNGETSSSTLNIIQQLVSNHPGDVYLNLHLIELVALNGNQVKALDLLKKWEFLNKKNLNPMLDYAKRRVSKTISMAIFEKKIRDFLHSIKFSIR
jgi:hypothetical protein